MKILRNDPALKQRRQELRRNQTEAERTFWSQIRSSQLLGLRFFRQYSIGPYILDFYCPAMRLAVEIDGGQHLDAENQEYDKVRSEYLQTHGIDVIRFWNHEVMQNMEGVLIKIEEAITPPHLPLPQGEE